MGDWGQSVMARLVGGQHVEGVLGGRVHEVRQGSAVRSRLDRPPREGGIFLVRSSDTHHALDKYLGQHLLSWSLHFTFSESSITIIKKFDILFALA